MTPVLNVVPVRRIVLRNALPKGLQNLSLARAVLVAAIAIQSVPLGPYKYISCLKIEQTCSNVKWVCVIDLLKIRTGL